MFNLLWRGGPGPNWVLDNSKIEPGLRELTAVVIMPSFVRGMRLDVSGDWFRLHDPDERKLHTRGQSRSAARSTRCATAWKKPASVASIAPRTSSVFASVCISSKECCPCRPSS